MKRILLSLVFSAGLLAACGRTSAATLNQSGNAEFAAQRYPAALDAYAQAATVDAARPEPVYNRANVYYRQNEYTRTVETLQDVLQIADDPLLVDSHFNLGNAAYNAGDYQAAVDAYKQVLRRQPNDLDAKHNLELALKKLKQEQEQQNKEQPKEDQQNQDQQNQDQQNQDQQNQDQQNQDQQNQDQQNQDQQNQDQPQTPQPTPTMTPTPTPAAPQSAQQPAVPTPGEPPTQQAKTRAVPAQGMSVEQARQLLNATAKDAQSLQAFLQQTISAPGAGVEKDW